MAVIGEQTVALVAGIAAEAQRIETPCGDGAMVWRAWGEGPPLVLLHGGYGSWMHWIRNVLPLARQFRVIAPDLPGLGESATPPEPWTAEGLAAIIAEGLASIVGGERLHLAGFSFGGVIGGNVAAQLGEQVRGFTVVGSNGLGLTRSPTELRRVPPDASEEEEFATHRYNLNQLMIADPDKIDELALYLQQTNHAFSPSGLPLGFNPIHAVYSGNATFSSSASATVYVDELPSITSTTILTLSSATVAAGAPVTLTAAVNAGRGSAMEGTVLFCNASAPHCEDSAVLGIAQLTSNGTAAIKLTLGVGSYSFNAIFRSENAYLGSTSAAQTLMVTANGSYATVTTISDTGLLGDYSLIGSVAAYGTTPLTGNLSFLDTSASNAVVATAALNGATLTYGFAPAGGSPLPEGDFPTNIVTADFNNDGILDLALVDNDGGNLYVYIGQGNGPFQNPVSYPLPASSVALAVGDFNGDGKLDIVTVNQGKLPTASVFLGKGDGTFLPQVPYTVGSVPSAVSVGDFNNDGILDLAVANTGEGPGQGSISILLGKGDGTFTLQGGEGLTNPDPNGPFFIATGDFNGDGNIDLAVCDLGGTVSVFLGNGDGTFQPLVSYAAGALPNYIVAADLLKNGKLDLAVANYGDSTVSVLLGNGDGTFKPQVTYATGNGPEDMTVGDFNNDGKLDLAFSDDNDTTISILYGNGDGIFQAPLIDNLVGLYPWGIAAGDFNGDGLTDLAVTNSGDGTVSVLLNQQIVTATATGVSVGGVGTHNVLASYPGDASRAASQSATVALMGTPLIVTSTALIVSPSTSTFGDSVMFTATVAPAPTGSPLGTVSFFSGKTLLGTGSVNSSGVVTFSSTSLLAGNDDLIAIYSGNSTSATSTSTDVLEAVNTAFAVTAPATPFVMAQGGSVSLTVNVPPLGGAFNNAVTLSATGLPPGATATFNPMQVTPGAAGAPTMLTIQLLTGAANGRAPGRPLKIPFAPLGIAVALCGMALGFHHSTRKIAKRSFALGGFLLVAAFLVSCNGGFAGKPGTLPGNFVITITGTSGNLHQSTTITLTVQ